MSYTILDIVTDAARIVNLMDETQQLSAEQGAMALTALNDLMADYFEDGIELGWYPQTDLSVTAPLASTDARCVKLCFAKELAMRAGLTQTLPDDLKEQMEEAYQKLAKRTLEYFESDMSNLPVPQGTFWGGGRT